MKFRIKEKISGECTIQFQREEQELWADLEHWRSLDLAKARCDELKASDFGDDLYRYHEV